MQAVEQEDYMLAKKLKLEGEQLVAQRQQLEGAIAAAQVRLHAIDAPPAYGDSSGDEAPDEEVAAVDTAEARSSAEVVARVMAETTPGYQQYPSSPAASANTAQSRPPSSNPGPPKLTCLPMFGRLMTFV